MNSKNNSLNCLVSIGIPTYNRFDDLKRAVSIARGQTYQNIEIIISDNASTDLRVASFLATLENLDPRIKVFFQSENIGILRNTEFVLKKSTGEYFTWLSDDDWRAPEFIESLLIPLYKNPNANFAFCDYTEVDENFDWVSRYPRSHRKLYRPLQNSSRLQRLVSFAWTDRYLGLGNCFYSLFRKKSLDALDLKKLSKNYTKLNMDFLIAYRMILDGPIHFSNDQMCKLTCGNVKLYEESIDQLLTPKPTSTFFNHTNLAKERLTTISELIRANPRTLDKMVLVAVGAAREISAGLRLARKALRKLLRLKKHEPQTVDKIFQQSTLDAEMATKVNLNNVTLIAVATKEVEETVEAIRYSCLNAEFGSVKLLSHFEPLFPKGSSIEYHKIPKMGSIDDWSKFVVYDLAQFVETDFVLLVHADGFVVNADAWKNEFLDYDYIGAPWPLPTDSFSYRDDEGTLSRVGNSVSLRSSKLLRFPKDQKLPWEPFHGFYNEDGFLCVKHRRQIENFGMKFAPLDIAKFFSHENIIPEVRNIRPFVFHKWMGTNETYPNFMKAFEVHRDRY
jgi:glycosyltransferase involved in cell wall biosynthesis